MDKQQLKEAVGELNLVDTVFEVYGVNYKDTAVSVRQVYDLIDQLDEPEVLSQEWMKDNQLMKIGPEGVVYYVPAENLQNLLVPKQEDLFNGKKPAIPKFVADYLYSARGDISLMRVLELANTRNELPKWEKEYDWISANHETFARAWLDGFTVEKEQKYYVPTGIDKRGLYENYLAKDHLGSIDVEWADETYFKNDKNAERYRFTEQEIRSMPKGDIYFKYFAVPV